MTTAAAAAPTSSTGKRRSIDLLHVVHVVSACAFVIVLLVVVLPQQPHHQQDRGRRRLSAAAEDPASVSSSSSGPIGEILSKATSQPPDPAEPFRILYIVTTLSEYDKGTRGTTRGADRLQNVVIPVIEDAISSMVERGWEVDLYLLCGYEKLLPDRRKLIEDALPQGVGLEVWEDAMPLFYSKSNANKPKADQSLDVASHGLSRQHRYVVRDKLLEYDFFAAFEDDMRITADHVVNYLEMSAGIERLRIQAENSPDGMVHVDGESNRDPSTRGKSMDKAPVGNDIVDDPISAEYLKRVIPGFVRVEVLGSSNPLVSRGGLDRPTFSEEVPIDKTVTIDPNYCCKEAEPGRGKMMPDPTADDVVIWETNVGAAGVREYPEPIGWVGAMPVEDRADVGSYWSGEGQVLKMSRPRRLDATLGQQAGWMATRSQVEYFHHEACPGGFLPPFDQNHWKGDSLQRHAVEFWSGGFQLFGQCFLNRILSMDPDRFSRQLLYHTANNKQSTLRVDKFVRAADFLGQLTTVKLRAKATLQARR
mmetsp:Transcript_6937/g.15140  ORF Transcript_6937/g.15140 Transcript_6937/m.15140 type:complete len:535 (+) Transcript_6937:18-1622(+)